jgi:hypothetical protein
LEPLAGWIAGERRLSLIVDGFSAYTPVRPSRKI